MISVQKGEGGGARDQWPTTSQYLMLDNEWFSEWFRLAFGIRSECATTIIQWGAT